MIVTFFGGLDVLYHHASLGEIVLCVPAGGAKIWCLYVFLCVMLKSRVHCSFEGDILTEQLFCRRLWVDFDSVFTFFSEMIALSESLDSSYFCR